MIELYGEVKVEGPFFKPEANARFRQNLYDAVEEVTGRGSTWARAGVQPRHGSGFTASGIEPYVARRQRLAVFGGGTVGSLFGTVRMKPGLTRGKSTTKYPSSRVPYIVAAVLETGKYRKARRQPALRFMRKAARQMRGYVDSIRADLTKGLN